MVFSWIPVAKYSAVVLSFSCLGAGACLFTHPKVEEIKNEELREEIEEQLQEELKQKSLIKTEEKDAVQKRLALAGSKNEVYAKIVVCFEGEKKKD